MTKKAIRAIFDIDIRISFFLVDYHQHTLIIPNGIIFFNRPIRILFCVRPDVSGEREDNRSYRVDLITFAIN